MTDWRDGYREALAQFVMEHGLFVELRYYPREEWDATEPDPEDYDDDKTYYGWGEWDHLRDLTRYGGGPACRIVEVDMASLRERTLMQFQDTFTGSKNEAGVEVRATCACGKYTNKWLRWVGTVGEILPALLAGTE